MLKGIPAIISPDLLKIMHEMGHGDDLVIGDANYPAASNAQRLIRCDGHGTTELLDAILQLFPLDSYVEYPVSLMQVVPGDPTIPEIQDEIKKVVIKQEGRGEKVIEYVERFSFYEKAKKAYAIVATTERKLYGCMIIKKGVIK
ncbi:MAG: RbsD or FucU transport [Pelosinus sp.]|jgi:L-fucose mutarotase|nr:RbsD or FucU transport [Pelosinus sp.]